ncbi:uncharacterized protein MONOS_12692c2 [Monocercomonoides exilis]|uniref:uncharacterized protein n=1 Tax=Monocercomonoides exilis TaxID=2049356 RepID=UPI00355A3A98|nr:hypothetical protein MONOS_12692c1 [Monocercomonoides exilis]KAH7826157.1 hypothetical protein MONOS_12692c2 [Monocercomonoides exilis]|eukprot:MONOS_12692.1-p1 / transcript=MONOS_12692.1 / gene=MONOS_12692 / organism=Monocercomonoides_exilis_PA203 / gene_product=unspecified product / transcript_product=unspecified product / location=Mono_scaffold00719:28943-29842(+) / protein_length=300 / sequence_SO=supercontig / SO=protein_coding / is_pseudo=false
MTKLIRNGIKEDESYQSIEIIEEIHCIISTVSNFKRSEFETIETSREESKSEESETESSEEDLFGLCMAEDCSEDDEFFMSEPFKQSEKKKDETMNESSSIHSAASSCSSSSESFSSTCLTSSQTLVFEDNSHDSLEDSMEDGTDEIEYGIDDVEVLFSNQKISLISRLEPEKEKEVCDQVVCSISSCWDTRIRQSFERYITTVLSNQSKEIRDICFKLFLEFLNEAPSFIYEDDIQKFYAEITKKGPIQTIYSNICFSLVSSPCSEASCERIFSRMKRISGDRRHSLSLEALNALLTI